MLQNKIIKTDSLDKLYHFGFTKIAAAIGVFDGIHLGHRKLINALMKMSKENSAVPIIITFFPHPRVVLQHDAKLRFLRDPDCKNDILESLGIKAVVTIPFNIEFASLPPNKFIKHFLLTRQIELTGICVGSEWRFGKKATGNADTLHEFAQKYGFRFTAVNELHRNNVLISSTAIRNSLKQGNFRSANFMLDCIYSIKGNVINIRKQPNCYNKVDVFIKYGILPPEGQYNIYIRKEKNKIRAFANVLTEDKLEIFYPKLDQNISTIEFEFINKIQ